MVPLVSRQLRLQELHDALLSHLLDDVTGQAVAGRSGLLVLFATWIITNDFKDWLSMRIFFSFQSLRQKIRKKLYYAFDNSHI